MTTRSPQAGEITRPLTSEPVVKVRDLRMRYGDNDVLTGVDFDIRAGEVVCLLGPNGAGKTTTIEILEGFRIRSAGEVSVLGQDPARGRRGLAGPHRGRPPVVARPPALDPAPAADPARRLLRALLDPRAAAPPRHRPAPRDGGPDRPRRPQDRHPVGRAAAAARRRGRDRRAARAAVPRRAHGRLRPAGPPRVPRPGAAARRPARARRSCSRPTTSTRPRSSPTGCSCWPPGGSSPTTPSTGSPAARGGGAGAVDGIGERPHRVDADATAFVRRPVRASSATTCRTSRCAGPASRTPTSPSSSSTRPATARRRPGSSRR